MEIPFLKELDREQLDLLHPLLETFTAPADTVVFHQGDRAVYLYMIGRGKVAVRYKPYDGPQIILTHLRAGDVFGWSSVIGSPAYTSDVICETQLDALRIRGEDLRQLCVDHTKAGCAILEKLAEVVSPRWKDARNQIHDLLQNQVDRETNR